MGSTKGEDYLQAEENWKLRRIHNIELDWN